MSGSTRTKILKNLSWLSGEHVCKTLIALPVSILVARYLGPEKFGTLSYAACLVGIFSPLAALGLSGIVVRDLVRKKHDVEKTLGSSFVLQFIGASVVTVLSIVTVLYLRPGKPIVQLVVAIAAFRNVFAAFQVIDYWFQSIVVSHHVAIGRVIATVMVAAIKLMLVWYRASLTMFAIATALETVFGVVFLWYAYRLNGQSLFHWKFSRARAKELLWESWPLTATGFAIVIQAYIDQVMLGQMLGDASVGQYSVAMKLIAAIAFLPIIMQKSWAPSVTAAKEQSEEAYSKRLSQLYQLMFGIFLLQGVPVFFLASPLVFYLYGPAYAQAGVLLSLLAFRLFFTNYGYARTVFITNEALFRHSMITAIAGTIVNVVANYFLIPHFGAEGAILATILSFTVTTFVLDAIAPSTRSNFKLMMNSPLAATSTAVQFLRSKTGLRL